MSERPAPAEGPDAEGAATEVLEPGRNVWRVAAAGRATVLADGAAYYGALRKALRKATRSIIVVGWDIDSRTRLVGETGEPEDDLPATFAAFLSELVRRRPELSVKLLLWDYSALYSLERELLPTLALRWNTPPQVDLCVDDEVPMGSSHHQKIVVIDDDVAFSGGLDITIRRWDTSEHDLDNPYRVDPGGEPYPPFHDIQMIVDGEAAVALGELARERWERATGERLSRPAAGGADDRWPDGLDADFTDIGIGIARTQPAYEDIEEIREVEVLFDDMIDAAERLIYIENQFLTCNRLAERIAERMKARPDLQVLMVAPRTHHTWLEHRTMLAGRIRFMRTLRRAGVADRVRLMFPDVRRGVRGREVMVHSKFTVIDDRLLRVGSANLCNRSFGADTECDLAVEAQTPEQRRAVARARDRRIGEHLGASAEDVARALAETGSLFATVDALGSRRRRLRPIDDGDDSWVADEPQQIETVADPDRPIGAEEYLADFSKGGAAGRQRGGLLKLGIVALVVIGLILSWRYTPLSDYANEETLLASFEFAADGPWAFGVVVGIFVLAGLVAFPVTLLIAATATAFGLWPGLAYATAGSLASAVVTYFIGRSLGADMLRRYMGPRIHRVMKTVNDHGILAVTTIRLVPTAPYMVVNLVAGAARISLVDYIVGTLLGLAPGLVVLSALGGQIFDVLTDPSLGDVLIAIGILAAWLGMSFALQRVVGHFRRNREAAS